MPAKAEHVRKEARHEPEYCQKALHRHPFCPCAVPGIYFFCPDVYKRQGPDSVTYKYFIEEAGCPTVFPFTAGSGSYTVMAFQNISGDRYASLFSQVIDVELENDFLPFLYPCLLYTSRCV